jgi:alpha-methylacyl-CoA racemase
VRRRGAVGEHSSLAFIALNQNKRSLQVDHRSPEGQDVVRALVRASDVFVEASPPGSLAKFGLDAERLRDVNPRLVYCSLSAYGDTGPLGGWPGHGYNIEANAGLVQVSVDPDGALRLPEYSMLPANLNAGYQAAMAVAAALVRVARTGQGAVVHVAAFDAGVCLDPNDAAHVLNGVPHDTAIGTRATPKYAAYRTKDGRAILIATLEPRYWRALCELLARPDLVDEHRDDLGSDYGHDRPHLYDILAAEFAARTLDEWMDLVALHPLPVSPIAELDRVVAGSQFAARELTRTTTSASGATVQTVRSPIVYDGARLGAEGRWSELGEDSDAVLRRIGYSDSEIDGLVARGVVRRG